MGFPDIAVGKGNLRRLYLSDQMKLRRGVQSTGAGKRSYFKPNRLDMVNPETGTDAAEL